MKHEHKVGIKDFQKNLYKTLKSAPKTFDVTVHGQSAFTVTSNTLSSNGGGGGAGIGNGSTDAMGHNHLKNEKDNS